MMSSGRWGIVAVPMAAALLVATEQYLDGTVRVEGDRLVVGLPDGTVVKQYHPTTHPQAPCA